MRAVGSRRSRFSGGVPSLLPNNSYETFFPNTETRLSEGGVWLLGRQDGLDANDMQTVPGKAFGRQNQDAGTTGSARDATAIMKGTWSPDQDVRATVYIDSLTGTSSPEVELRLRCAVTAHSISGYEVAYSCATVNPYILVAIWYGPIAQGQGVSYDYLFNSNDQAFQIVTGDVIRATIVGTTLRVFRNSTELISPITTTSFATGAPGFGHNQEQTFPATSNSQYGISHFLATAA